MENITEKTIRIARTKSGSPCLWESYTEFDNLKRAISIINKDGDIKKSIFIRKNGSKQALIPVQEGDIIIKQFEDPTGGSLSILEIRKIANNSNHAELLLKYRSSPNENTGELEMKFEKVLDLVALKMKDPTYIISQIFEKN